MYLLNYFRDYMAKTLERDVDWTWVDMDRQQDMDFLMRYYRMKLAIVFKLSNDILQVRRDLMVRGMERPDPIVLCSSTSLTTPSCC